MKRLVVSNETEDKTLSMMGTATFKHQWWERTILRVKKILVPINRGCRSMLAILFKYIIHYTAAGPTS